jgi:beta-barrel assembly-enhancing protease
MSKWLQWSTRRTLMAVACVLVALRASPAWARYEPGPCKNSFSIEQEIAAGGKAKAQVYKSLPVLPDSGPVTEYVQQLGADLVEYAPGYRWPYEFHVVNEADINAFALPGGPIFVNLGTIQAAETESQLAGVLAHEISHVVQRHATCNETKQRTSRILAGIGELAAGVLVPGAVGAVAQQGIGAAAGIGFLHMSRASERQADLMGADIMYDAGYDPRGLPQFFEVTASKYGKGGAQWLSDHPNPGNRTGYVNDEIDTLPRKASYLKTSEDFLRLKKQVSTMHAYSAKEVASGVWKRQQPSQPVAEGVQQSVAFTASNTLKQLETAQYKLSYPDDWKVRGGAESVTITPEGGIDTLSADGDAVTCGVLIDSFQPPSGASLNDGFDQIVRDLRQQNPGLRQVGSVTDLQVGQARGRSVDLTGVSAREHGGQPAPEHDWLVAVLRPDGTLNTLVFVAPGNDAVRLRPAFERILQSFQAK